VWEQSRLKNSRGTQYGAGAEPFEKQQEAGGCEDEKI